MSGIVVYINHAVSKPVKRIYTKLAILLLFDKTVFNLERDLIMCFIYLPTENSPCFGTSGIKLLENYLLKPEFMNLDANLLIMRDLNAGVGENDDLINDNHVVPSLRHYEEYLLDDINVNRV